MDIHKEQIEKFLKDQDDFDVIMLTMMISCMSEGVSVLEESANEFFKILKVEDYNRRYYQKRKAASDGDKKWSFVKWNEIVANTPDFIFCKKFRMMKETFAVLAEKICSLIGKKTFRPAAKCHNGFISGEVRMAISIRMLSGRSHLDLMGVTGFGIKSSGHIYHIFHDFIGWLHNTFDFPLVHMLRAFDLGDKEALAALHQISM